MRIKLYFTALVLFIILILIFVGQNINPVTLKLWFWETNISLSLVIVSSIIIGALIFKFVSMSGLVRREETLIMHDEEVDILKENIRKLEKERYKTRKKLLQKEKNQNGDKTGQ